MRNEQTMRPTGRSAALDMLGRLARPAVYCMFACGALQAFIGAVMLIYGIRPDLFFAWLGGVVGALICMNVALAAWRVSDLERGRP